MLALYVALFFNTSAMFAENQFVGRVPLSRLCWKMICKMGATSRASSFSTLGCIASGPAALEGSAAGVAFVCLLCGLCPPWLGVDA